MNKILKIETVRKLFGCCALLAAGLLLYNCSDDTYDKHYDEDSTLSSGVNLWKTIETIPELSSFTQLLKDHGYDEILSQQQAYTIFAPDNETMAQLDLTGMDVKTELIENHVARYFLPATGSSARTVATLNKKRVSMISSGEQFYYGNSVLHSGKSVTATNGIVHLLTGYEPFFPNVWEYLDKRSELDSIKNYLYSFNQIIFDESQSVPGSIVNGQQTYLDSVFLNYNSILSQLGYINREDSSYTMVVPDNGAWDEAYSRIKDYYVYYDTDTHKADSLQHAKTSFAIVQDLFFNDNVQKSPADSLTSTYGNIFYEPQYLFAGTEEVECSNGKINISNQLKYKNSESWQPPLIIEAERTFGRENTLSNPYSMQAENITLVSSGRYLRLEPTTSSGNPTATFSIYGALSSYYNVYCVFVSDLVANPNATGLRPRKVYFNLNFRDLEGKDQTTRFPQTGSVETDPYVMDTVLVASDFKFPVTDYGLMNSVNISTYVPIISLKVISNVARTETTKFSRELLIDCILLEPKEQD